MTIRVGAYGLAHLPGFDHDVTAGEVTARKQGIEIRVVSVDPNDLLPSQAPADQQVEAAWAKYAAARGIETIKAAPVPEVMLRPNGMFTTLIYVADEGGKARVGRFSLHRSNVGPALIIDSATHHPDVDSVNDDAVAEAQVLGGAVENFLCVPGQSADPSTDAYAISCDLERSE